MPPFGITAIVEYIQAKDAKNAFTNLAYSKVSAIVVHFVSLSSGELGGAILVPSNSLIEMTNLVLK